MADPQRYGAIIGLIGLAAVVFAAEQVQRASWSEDYGAVPAVIVPAYRQLVSGDVSLFGVWKMSGLVTAIFLHANGEHILYNMVFLWAFGFLTAQLLGQWRMLAIFLLCGVVGNIAQVWLNADSFIPIIGASGAISGLQGVYLGLAVQWRLPNAEVWPLAYPVPPLQVAAFAVLGFFGDILLMANHEQRIAYGAHIGGLLTGVVVAAILTTVYRTLEDYQRAARMA